MKLQIAFRDTGHVENGFKTVVAIGLIEFRDLPGGSEAPEGMIGEFIVDMVNDQGALRPCQAVDQERYRFPKDRWGHKPWPETSAPDMITESVWKAPWFNGGSEFFLLRTRVEPSSEGLAVMCMAGLVAVKGQLQVNQDSVFQMDHDGERFVFEGKVGEDLRPEWGAPELATKLRGCAFSSFLRQPVWGFGTEPVGIGWHMSLPFAEAFDRYRDLALKDKRDEWEEGEHAVLLKRMSAAGMANVDRDPAFRSYLKEMDGRGLVPRSVAMPETRAQLESRERVAAEVLSQALVAAETSPSMSL